MKFIYQTSCALTISCANRYKFSFTAADDTAEAQFFAYDDAARNIIHRNVRAVLNQLNKGSGFPQFLTDVISKKFTFNVNLTDDSFGEMKDRTYIVKSVAADHQVQAYKAKQQVLTQPTGDTSLTLTPIVSKEHTIQSNTPSNSANTVPDIMDTGGSSVRLLIFKYLYLPIYLLCHIYATSVFTFYVSNKHLHQALQLVTHQKEPN